MKPAYIVFGVVGVVVVVWWVAFVRQETEPIVPDYDSPAMIFQQKKATADLLYGRGKQDGNFADAIVAYKDAISVSPENSLALNDLGSCYYDQGLHDMPPPAEEDLREGEALVEEDVRRYSRDPGETLKYIKRILAGSPSGRYVWDVPSGVVEPLRAFLEQQYPQASIVHREANGLLTVTIVVPPSLDAIKDRIRQAIEETPSGKFTWVVPGAVGEDVEAFLKASYPRALTHVNQFGRDYEVVVITGGTGESFRQAEVYFRSALNAKAEYARPYRNLGALYVQRGRRDDAIQLFEEAIKLEPQDQELSTYLDQLKGY